MSRTTGSVLTEMPFSSSDGTAPENIRKNDISYGKSKIFIRKKQNRLPGISRKPVFILLWSMKNIEEKSCLCALNRIFGFDPKTGLALLSHFGSASEVFRSGCGEADRLLGPYSRYRGAVCGKAKDEAYRELEELEKTGITFAGWTEECYPGLLKECPDAPIGIYIRSGTEAGRLFGPRRRIAVIGTRDLTPYGRDWCERIVIALASLPEKPVIVSGLALGTDICAHLAALEAGLDTIGVMATGPESVYPYRHRLHAKRIAETYGSALITDYPPGTAPLPVHFLRRNRIIAGLCEATVLIESRAKGGGMMTARLAHSYNRDVFALPGRADDTHSQGCNILIQNRTAEAIASVATLTDSLGMGIGAPTHPLTDMERLKQTYGNTLTDSEMRTMSRILATIRKERGITLDGLAEATGCGYSDIAHIAGILECDGFISLDLLQRCTVNNFPK